MKPKQAERREQWHERIAQQETAGQSVRAFCGEQGLNKHTFYAWRQRLRCETRPVTFALIESQPLATEVSWQPIELMLAGGDRLRIPTEAAALRLVLSVLREQQR